MDWCRRAPSVSSSIVRSVIPGWSCWWFYPSASVTTGSIITSLVIGQPSTNLIDLRKAPSQIQKLWRNQRHFRGEDADDPRAAGAVRPRPATGRVRVPSGERRNRCVTFAGRGSPAARRLEWGLLFHDLRRSATMNLRNFGIPRGVIQKIRGAGALEACSNAELRVVLLFWLRN